MANQKTYRIGTRGSLLALTQCNQVKDQLELLTGDRFELEVIKTQGDMITNAPLWQLDGKDFFTKELDEALLSKKIDMVVHSYKDLGSVRPEGIHLAAVTKRTYAHDILLIKEETKKLLSTKKEFIVGTSSPRRIANIEKYLTDYIPHLKNNQASVKTKMLRGNVNSRIQKLQDGEYDAIVLALPGIERLALTESSKIELTRLLHGIDFLILPQSIFPSSASQGALGIECLKENTELLNKLKMIEDADTLEEVSRERKSFNEYGGGCHLAVGINVRKFKINNQLTFFHHVHKGTLNEQDVIFNQLEGRNLPQFFSRPKTFNGHKDDQLISKSPIHTEVKFNEDDILYVTSKHCYHLLKKISSQTFTPPLWSAGTKSMKDLVQMGFWVQGTSDSKGDSELESLLNSKVVQMMLGNHQHLKILTNDEGSTTLKGEIIKAYTRQVHDEQLKNIEAKIKETEVFFWTSFHQYKTYTQHFPEIKKSIHATGVGKTYSQILKSESENEHCKINLIPFANMEEYKNWIGDQP